MAQGHFYLLQGRIFVSVRCDKLCSSRCVSINDEMEWMLQAVVTYVKLLSWEEIHEKPESG